MQPDRQGTRINMLYWREHDWCGLRKALRFQKMFIFVNIVHKGIGNGKYNGVVFFIVSCIFSDWWVIFYEKSKTMMMDKHCDIKGNNPWIVWCLLWLSLSETDDWLWKCLILFLYTKWISILVFLEFEPFWFKIRTVLGKAGSWHLNVGTIIWMNDQGSRYISQFLWRSYAIWSNNW